MTKFINYGDYSGYMMSSIQISEKSKKLISSFGTKDDTYEDIILRMYDLAAKQHLREFLMSSENTISIDEARRLVNEKWPK